MTYLLFITIPIIVVVITQIVKLSIDKIQGNLNVRNIFISYGGMPSAHTSLAVSLVTMIGIVHGVQSASFAVAFIFTIIIMRDAITFRNILGKQGQLLNQLVNKLPQSEQNKMPKFAERIGHSITEVLVGALFGFVSTLILYYIFSIV